MRLQKKAFGLVFAVGVAALTTQTRAFELIIDPSFGSTENTGSTATLTFEFSEYGSDDLLTILIANTTPPKIGSRLTAVGLELPDWLIQSPSLVVPQGTAYFDTLTFNDSMSPGWLDAPGGYDLVITSEGNFLGGNPNGAPTAGAQESVMLSLGDTGLTPQQLDMRFFDFFTDFTGRSVVGRFQSVGPNGQLSDKVGGSVPEPATVILLALGGLALLRRGH
jgi:PEP-CTERM motif